MQIFNLFACNLTPRHCSTSTELVNWFVHLLTKKSLNDSRHNTESLVIILSFTCWLVCQSQSHRFFILAIMLNCYILFGTRQKNWHYSRLKNSSVQQNKQAPVYTLWTGPLTFYLTVWDIKTIESCFVIRFKLSRVWKYCIHDLIETCDDWDVGNFFQVLS